MAFISTALSSEMAERRTMISRAPLADPTAAMKEPGYVYGGRPGNDLPNLVVAISKLRHSAGACAAEWAASPIAAALSFCADAARR